jgi:hypothetical protein
MNTNRFLEKELIETSTLVSLEQAGKLIETKFYKNNVI